MSKLNFIMLFFWGISSLGSANAAIALDRTRVIYEAGSKAISVNISNENKQLPYLAQAWIENSQQRKVNGPLIVTPPVQRVEPGAKSMVRISTMPAVDGLPQDRETLFYFNLREIPPRSDKPNVMQIALQTKVKLFYRPKALVAKSGTIWQEQLVLHKTANGYRIENPTPYYITVVDITGQENKSENKAFKPLLLAPKSSSMVASPSYEEPQITYINDYGGRPTLKFSCVQQRCSTLQR